MKKGTSIILRNVPNCLSVLRIFMAAALLFVMDSSDIWIVLILYAACGLSDVADGYLARRLGCTSTLGARLDSAGDIVMFGVVTVFFVRHGAMVFMWFVLPLLAIILVRIAAMVIALVKYRRYAGLHTWGNKAAGLLVYVSPVFFHFSFNRSLLAIVCGVAFISAVEECLIHLQSSEIDLDRRSLLWGK